MPTSYRARLMYASALWGSSVVHHNLVHGVSNTPEGMFVYHGSAAATDFLLLIFAANLLSGRLSKDMQILCWLSMVVNFCGWLLYLAYSPPIAYQYAIKALGYVQFLRLLPVGIYVDRAWQRLVRSHHPSGPQLHFEKAKR